MRNATILVIRLRGIATEVIKNVVLAGIGKLIIVDDENVSEEDLGAGFFYRDGDVGLKVSYIITDGYTMVISRSPCIAETGRCQIKNRKSQSPCDCGNDNRRFDFERRA